MAYPVELRISGSRGADGRDALLRALTAVGGVADCEVSPTPAGDALVAMPDWYTPVITVPGDAGPGVAQLSWGMSVEAFRAVMTALVALSGRAGLQVFDPQVRAPVRQDTLMRMCSREPADTPALNRFLNAGGPVAGDDELASGEDFPPEYERGEIGRGDPVLAVLVAALEFSVRASRVLRDAGIDYVGELLTSGEAALLQRPNCGRKTLHELQDVLGRAGLRLGMRVLNWA